MFPLGAGRRGRPGCSATRPAIRKAACRCSRLLGRRCTKLRRRQKCGFYVAGAFSKISWNKRTAAESSGDARARCLRIDMKTPDFASASREALAFLHARLGMGLWMITRADDDDWVILSAEDHAYGLEDRLSRGLVLRWSDSFCARMARGRSWNRSSATSPIARCCWCSTTSNRSSARPPS